MDLSKVKVLASSQPAVDEAFLSTVPNRVAHIDADFVAYQISAERKAELDPDDPTPRRTLEQMKENAVDLLNYIRQHARAERAVAHVTTDPSKGWRTQQARIKPYQENRSKRNNSPEHLHSIRSFIGNLRTDTVVGMNHDDQEADDGMAQAAYADPDNAIICSMDKDLSMVPGWRLCMKTYEIRYEKDSFGWIEINCSTKNKKVVGSGTKFFWTQMLMGDPADNISGLPFIPKDMNNPEPRKKSEFKRCGPVVAYELLKDLKTDMECYDLVKSLYDKLQRSEVAAENYRNGRVLSTAEALLSEMRLLWMRRTKDPNDVINFLKEIK